MQSFVHEFKTQHDFKILKHCSGCCTVRFEPMKGGTVTVTVNAKIFVKPFKLKLSLPFNHILIEGAKIQLLSKKLWTQLYQRTRPAIYYSKNILFQCSLVCRLISAEKNYSAS